MKIGSLLGWLPCVHKYIYINQSLYIYIHIYICIYTHLYEVPCWFQGVYSQKTTISEEWNRNHQVYFLTESCFDSSWESKVPPLIRPY